MTSEMMERLCRAIDALLMCPEIADADPREKDEETHAAEREARNARDDAKVAIAAINTRTPAPAAGELAALAEDMEDAAFEHGRVVGSADELRKVHERYTHREDARADFHTALSTHLAEVRAAIGPFVRLHKKRDEIYRKRGGNQDIFPDTHPAYDISARDMPVGVWRGIAALAKKLEG